MNICDDFSWDLRVTIENDDDDDNKRVGVIPTCPYKVIRGPISFVFYIYIYIYMYIIFFIWRKFEYL